MAELLMVVGVLLTVVFGYVSAAKVVHLPHMQNKTVHFTDFHIFATAVGLSMVAWSLGRCFSCW